MAAMTKRKGRRRKSGRKRNITAPRKPSGKIRYERLGATPEYHQKRLGMLRRLAGKPIDMEDLQRMAKDGDAGWFIGQLRLVGRISQEQRDAAHRFKMATAEYKAALLLPKPPRALDVGRVLGASVESEEQYRRRFQRAKQTYERYDTALRNCGHLVTRDVVAALNDEEVNLERLKVGLDALASV